MDSTTRIHTEVSLEPHANPRAGETEEAFDTASFALGALQVVVHSEAPLLTQNLLTVYSGAGVPCCTGKDGQGIPQSSFYQVRKEATLHEGPPSYRVARDGETCFQNCSEEEVLHRTEWAITDAARRGLAGYHRLHAGAVARNGHGILLPGPSGAGKSTTVAALALNGFEYCSDELALVGPDARLRPFPRIISLKEGGWRQIAERFPDAALKAGWPSVADGSGGYMKPPMCPDPMRARQGYPIDFVIISHHGAGQTNGLNPIPKSMALKELVEQSLDLELRGPPGLELLAEVIRGAECYSLSCDDLPKATKLIESLTR